MKKLLVLLMLVGCKATNDTPPVDYENGFTFEVPCENHGGHIKVVSGTFLVRMYELADEYGSPVGAVSDLELAEVLTMIEQ